MTPDPGPPVDLLETLRDAQRLGMLGDRPIPEVVGHAHAFVVALADVHGTVLDLGAGGGVPGLVIAVERPDLRIVLLDRRQKRTDVLARAVHRLGLHDRVEVRCDDARRTAATEPHRYDAVTARGFGPPDATLRLAAQLVAPAGRIVISEPPEGDRWDPSLLATLGLERVATGTVAVFRPR